ncbi:MAG TPA: ABC transporter ATP-binding protein, partial [Solirubrobacterales bacterium]|nr:ABC transporter ATP-binding protein [Solirubrobacterales bacterium]
LVHGIVERGEEVEYAAELLERVGIRRESMRRFPHEFSGGQRQRIAIARSLAVRPKLLIADEALSALDVSIQAQLLGLLEEIRRDFGLTIVFIAHQLAVISRLADRVAIMYLGKIVETGATADVFANPRHPYTRALLEAHPRIDGTRVRKPAVRTDSPSPYAIPSGCRFHPRCPLAEERCAREEPAATPVDPVGGGHYSACHVLAPAAAEGARARDASAGAA